MKVLFALAMATLATRAVDAQTAVEGRPPVTISVGGGVLMPVPVPRTSNHRPGGIRPGTDFLSLSWWRDR